ncbi:MAG: membrane or secreted protein [Bacteroidetes bacterium]|nr:MAG: membrane or secreted protein [Bacteroidota bacterium]
MKKIPAFLWLCLALTLWSAQAPVPADNPLVGAWRLEKSSQEDGLDGVTIVRILSPSYTMMAAYREGEFIGSSGGSYTFDPESGESLYTVDYNTWDSSMVGRELPATIEVSDDRMFVRWEEDNMTFEDMWVRLDAGDSPLAGHWKIRARARDGEMVEIHQRGTRQTIKILSGTRFQWTAMDYGTKQFMGCGGGTYTFEDGVYTEHIEFFSRDNSRVGMSLSFEGKVEGDDWHHSGKSSRGQPISEIWARQ